ncbi:chorismate mutase [Chloroflexota bacterium]
MKNPHECRNMEDIREAIDEIDRDIISLISERAEYVYAAAKFKTDKTSVKADDRVKALLQKRAEWAEEKNLNPDIIVKIYAELVNFFINEEMIKWEKGK